LAWGIMGGAIARNLVQRGWTVVGFDTEPARRSELGLAGDDRRWRGRRRVRAALIMTSLPNADAGQMPSPRKLPLVVSPRASSSSSVR